MSAGCTRLMSHSLRPKQRQRWRNVPRVIDGMCARAEAEQLRGKMKSVKAFSQAFLAKFDRLDVLAVVISSKIRERQKMAWRSLALLHAEGWEWPLWDGLFEAFFATNYLGAFLLAKLLKDVLKRSGGGNCPALHVSQNSEACCMSLREVVLSTLQALSTGR
eukprot:2798427-Amphidinium_carterae.1